MNEIKFYFMPFERSFLFFWRCWPLCPFLKTVRRFEDIRLFREYLENFEIGIFLFHMYSLQKEFVILKQE